MSRADLRAARANRVFCTDKKRIRTENTVMDKNKEGLGLVLSEVVDCARICFSSVRNRWSARTVFRPRNTSNSVTMQGVIWAYLGIENLAAVKS